LRFGLFWKDFPISISNSYISLPINTKVRTD
jgi:hypothetical protein